MPVLKVKKNGIWEPISGGGSGNGTIPDWNQNDSAAADYIKNRPFYTAQVEKEIYDVNAELTAVSGTLTSQQVSATEYLHSVNTTDLDYAVNLADLVVGKQYVVIIDGNRYEYTAKSMVMPEGYNGAIALYIGEGEEFISQDIANFTVGIANVVYPNGYSLATIGCKTTSATPPASFKIYAVEEEVKQLNPKYYERLAWTEEGARIDTLEFDGDIEVAVENEQAVQMDEGSYAVTLFNRYIDPYSLVGGTISVVSFDESICPSQDVEITEEMITDMSADMGFEAYGIGAVRFSIENEDGSTSYMSFSIMILSQDFMGMIKKGVLGQYESIYGYISKVTAPTAVFGDPDIIHTIDPKYFAEGTVGWTEKGSASNIWEFNGNLDSVEHYQIGEGQYYIRVLDTYQEPEFFVGVTSEINAEGNILTGVFTEDMIEDMSEQTGFPAYGIQNRMGLVLSQEFNGMPEGFYVIYVQDNTVVQKITFTQDVFSEPDIIHKINQKYIPNADWSINDSEAEGYIKNRPFYDGRIIGDVSIDWDGSTDGKTVIGHRFYKVSDNVITEDQFKEATFTFEGGTYPTSILYSNDLVLVTENYINADFLMIVTTPFDLEDGNGTLAETGIYFSSGNGMSNLTYKDYIGGDFVKIDPVYLPDNFGGGNEIYVQPEAPESPSEGALWVDTDEGSSGGTGGSTGGSTGNCSIELDDTLTQSGKAADAKAVGDALANIGDEAIISVTQLPTENINEDVLYRLTTGMVVFNGQNGRAFDDTAVYIVDSLPETGEPCSSDIGESTAIYYNTSNGAAYGYIDDRASVSLIQSVGWKSASTAFAAMGYQYSGVVTSMNDVARSSAAVLLEHALYHYKNGWERVAGDTPFFDLSNLGLEAVDLAGVADGVSVRVSADTRAIINALARGAVKFGFQIIYNGATLDVEALGSAMYLEAENMYQIHNFSVFADMPMTVTISVDKLYVSVSVAVAQSGGTSTTLPNPHKLTFSGAVSAEYDGSEPVEVVIPEGGSALPTVSAEDDGKILMVKNGEWTAVTLPNAEGASF